MTQPLRAAALLSVMLLLARVVGLVQTVVVGTLIPRGDNDAYKAAFGLIEFVNYLVAGGALSVTFIPLFTLFKNNDNERDAWRFFSAIASIMTCILVVIITLSYLLATPVARWYYSGFDEERLALTVKMTRILLPAQIFFYLGGMIVGVLNAHKRFGASSLTGVAYNIVALITGVALWFLLGHNSVGFAWGILIGAFFGNFLLPLVAALRAPSAERLRFRFLLDFRQPGVARFFRNTLPIMLGVSFPVIDQFVLKHFASFLREGTIAQLDNGNRVMLAPLAILAQAASVAAFPYLAGDSATKQWSKFADFLRSGLRRLLFISLPASTLLILLAQPLIIIVFRHGEYSMFDAQETALAFAFYCVGLFAWAGQQLVARGLYALQDTVTPTLIGSILTIFLYIPLCWLAVRWNRHEVLGLALATSVGASAHFCGVFIALERKLAQREYATSLRSERVLGTLLRTLAACCIMGIVGLLVKNFADAHLPHNRIGDIGRLFVISTVSVAAFIFAAQRFQIPEWAWLQGKILRRKR